MATQSLSVQMAISTAAVISCVSCSTEVARGGWALRISWHTVSACKRVSSVDHTTLL